MTRWLICAMWWIGTASIFCCGCNGDAGNTNAIAPQATPDASVGKGVEYFFPICCNERFGVIDPKGNVLLEPRYHSASAVMLSNTIFTRGMGQTSILLLDYDVDGKQWIFISSEGTKVFPGELFPCSYCVNLGDSLFVSFSPYSAVQALPNESPPSATVFDPTARWTPPEGYLPRMTVSQGRVPVSKNGKWGFCDRDGRIVVPAQYDFVHPFFEGLAAVCDDGKWGFIDLDGNTQIVPQFEAASNFSEGFALTKSFDEESGFFIDPKGKKHQEFSPTDWIVSMYAKHAWGNGLTNMSDSGAQGDGIVNFGAVNRDGQWVAPPVFWHIDTFSEGYAIASPKAGAYRGKRVLEATYLMDTSGNLIGPLSEAATNWSIMRHGLVGTLDASAYFDKTGHRVGECTKYGEWKSYVRADPGPAEGSDQSTAEEKKMMATQKSTPNDVDE